MKYFVVADVHGFYYELINALNEKGFNPKDENHKLIVCGDLMDRGPEAVQLQDYILRLMEKDKVVLIKGNHEDLIQDLIINIYYRLGCKEMEINGIKIKKYRARVKARDAFTTAPVPISADGYKEVVGYVSIAAVVIPYEGNTPQYVPVFVAEEVDIHRMGTSGFGKSVFNPVTYAEGDFEIIGEVE